MMIFSNLTLSGVKYGVDNLGLLTVLNNHVVTDILEEASLKAGPKLSPKRNFQYKRMTKFEKSVSSNDIHDGQTLQNITHSAVSFSVHFRVPDMFRMCNHAHG
jgi:hypothetical protein